ncbi:MAG: 60S ribosomal protein L37a, putative [Candidatus Parvarchaeum acidiphilum ARMAN-4]|jgi:large subunit ribosomal protein L37Ae|uniref:50S ribosomal protein L37Ae n=1 Tax=Candidatus Parvarchaeum acidiphilum ARMAN-4 TaxID=662760 RepID=D2EEZ7_PARA4|nr:MAG: 60S ribosomal protein L37a, putative [Candidatus Parvarchaeum acidiphilum ARMAN-4]
MRTAKYGVGVRKRIDAIKQLRSEKYPCPRCKKLSIRRKSAGIWKCKHCGLVIADNAYSLSSKVI